MRKSKDVNFEASKDTRDHLSAYGEFYNSRAFFIAKIKYRWVSKKFISISLSGDVPKL